MDLFDDILKQASSNTQNASKEIKKIDEARQNTTKCMNVRLAEERKQSKVVKPIVKKPEFVIPEKKVKEGADVDKRKVELFLKRKEEEKQKAFTEKKKQKEELLKLRLRSYGGKANKKLAKQFGSTPIELQQKYGTNREHVERLIKQQMREEEEAERLSSELRGSVVRALERKKVADKIANAESCRNGPYRVGINKKNSLRHLTKEDSPGPSSPCVSKGKSRKTEATFAVKRRLPPSESDFYFLMKKAEALQKGKASPSPPSFSVPSPAAEKANNYLLRRDIGETENVRESKSKTIKESTKKNIAAQRSLDSTKKINSVQSKEHKVLPQISSGSSFKSPSRGYLPGDIRYQGIPPERSQKSIETNGNSLNAAKTKVKESNNRDVQRGSRKFVEQNASARNRQNSSKRVLSREEAIARFKAYERLKERRLIEQLRRARDRGLDKDVDDECDSEMDDFIDDSAVDEHLKRGDLEETLRLINPRYDKNRWKLRERMIDDRRMEASYRDIAREEKRSARIGLIEDLREAQHGKSIAL